MCMLNCMLYTKNKNKRKKFAFVSRTPCAIIFKNSIKASKIEIGGGVGRRKSAEKRAIEAI